MARDETEALLSASVDQSDFSRCLQWRFVIVTQDCDLVAEEDKEPYVEFIGDAKSRARIICTEMVAIRGCWILR